MAKRTIEDLRKQHEGKVYVYFKNDDICKQFLKDAEAEGYRFGDIKPTENKVSDIIAVEDNKQLSYVGHIGHIAFQSSSDLTRVDYEKFITGDSDYLYVKKR